MENNRIYLRHAFFCLLLLILGVSASQAQYSDDKLKTFLTSDDSRTWVGHVDAKVDGPAAASNLKYIFFASGKAEKYTIKNDKWALVRRGTWKIGTGTDRKNHIILFDDKYSAVPHEIAGKKPVIVLYSEKELNESKTIAITAISLTALK